MAAKGLLRHNDPGAVRAIVPQNAKLKYAGNVRAGESRYSIITGLLHLQLIPDARCGNPFQSPREKTDMTR